MAEHSDPTKAQAEASGEADVVSFVIVGHVDHGKSTLMGRLLYETDSAGPEKMAEAARAAAQYGAATVFANLVDRLEEERQQAMTMETAQAFVRTAKRFYVMIDAPGQVEFVRNMVTGASQADAAVVIVDVTEGVREQTRRHAYLLSVLGVNQLIVAVNKMDLVDFVERRFEAVREQMGRHLRRLGMEALFYIPISAMHGDNVASRSERTGWYEGPSLLEGLAAFGSTGRPEGKGLIFPVQDVYRLDGQSIAAGTVAAGVLERGQFVQVLPAGYKTKVRSIHRFASEVERAVVGESVGVIAAELPDIKRGDVICTTEAEVAAASILHTTIFWMAKSELKKGQRLTIRCATQQARGRVVRIAERIDSSSLEVMERDAAALRNLEAGTVTIKTQKPIVVTGFDKVRELGRCVLVQGDNICAGGIIRGRQ